jgi:hypothetical protein
LLPLFSSCSEYQAIKSEDAVVKLDVATKLYELKNEKTIRLFEQIASE